MLLVAGAILGVVALAWLASLPWSSPVPEPSPSLELPTRPSLPLPLPSPAPEPSLPSPSPGPDVGLWWPPPMPPALQLPASVLVGIGVLVAALAVTALAARLLSRRSATREQQAENPNLDAHLQVFVSYSRLDGKIVDRVVKEIEQAGYPVWIDRELSHGAQRYAAPIVRAIKSSKLVALMCSRNAFQSDHVIRELYVAGDYKKPFIAFQLDQSEFPEEVQYFVSGFPRLAVGNLESGSVRSEIARLVAS
jgi:TIR domain